MSDRCAVSGALPKPRRAAFPSDPRLTLIAAAVVHLYSKGERTPMPLCFIEPHEAIRVVAESVGREARRQLLGEVVRAWVEEIPDDELEVHYAKAVDDLDEDDVSMLAAWHASLEVGHPVANKDFLLRAFPGLGDHRREALRIAAGFRGEEAFEAGAGEEPAPLTVPSRHSAAWTMEL